MRSIGRYDGSCRLSVWLCQIAKHLWYQHLRKTRRQSETLTEDITLPVPSAEDDVLLRAEYLDLLRAVHTLPEPAREVLYLRLFGGLSFREISDVLGKTENWSRVTFYRAKGAAERSDGTGWRSMNCPAALWRICCPPYVDGLTGQESSAAVRRHLEGCPACREKYETMGAAEREVAQKDAPVIDAFAAWNRKAVRRVVLAVAGTVVLIVLALVLRTYVFGTPFRDYELEWTVQDYGSYVDIRVAPLDPNLRILGGTWEETVEDGQSTYRFTGKKYVHPF